MATIVSALLQTSQDRDSGVPERLQSLESSVAALSESVAGLAWHEVRCKHGEIQSWAIALAVHLLDRHRQLLSEPGEACA